jgi:hypothetical protein
LEALKNRKREREELGVQLYGSQQELARQQMLLEKEHDVFNDENQMRTQCEMTLNEVKTMHKQIMDDLNHNRRKGKSAWTNNEGVL